MKGTQPTFFHVHFDMSLKYIWADDTVKSKGVE